MRTQIESWKQDVWDKRTEVDPDDKLYWGSLAFGYFLGLGLSIADAHNAIEKINEEGLI